MRRTVCYALWGMIFMLAGPRPLVRADDSNLAPPPASTVIVPAPYWNGSSGIPAGAVVAPAPGSDWVEVPVQHEPRRFRPIRNFFHDQGTCCWSGVNTVGCGSLKAELDFIFGSCRRFYGEPCYQGPPPLLLPQGYPSPAATSRSSGGCACP
jgi:hypothetical protein